MSEQQFLWNSLDGGENVFIKERESDKSIHIKIIEGKHEFVDFMKKVNEQQGIIEEKNNVITLMGAFIKNNGFSIDDFNEWISKDWHNVGDK
jgi:hypothetical protein